MALKKDILVHMWVGSAGEGRGTMKGLLLMGEADHRGWVHISRAHINTCTSTEFNCNWTSRLYLNTKKH